VVIRGGGSSDDVRGREAAEKAGGGVGRAMAETICCWVLGYRGVFAAAVAATGRLSVEAAA